MSLIIEMEISGLHLQSIKYVLIMTHSFFAFGINPTERKTLMSNEGTSKNYSRHSVCDLEPFNKVPK